MQQIEIFLIRPIQGFSVIKALVKLSFPPFRGYSILQSKGGERQTGNYRHTSNWEGRVEAAKTDSPHQRPGRQESIHKERLIEYLVEK